MKIKVREKVYHSIEYYVDDVLNHGYSAMDAIDALRTAGWENLRAIGSLLDALANKELLTASEVSRIVEGFPNSFVEFCEEENEHKGED